MTTATTRSDLHLPVLTSFLTLAPTQSACYPTRRRTPSDVVVSSDSQASAEPTSTAEVPVGVAEQQMVTETVKTEVPVIPTTNVSEEAEAEMKIRRSSSLSSDGSLKTFRFLRLGPVHHGEQDGDWSEEVAVAE